MSSDTIDNDRISHFGLIIDYCSFKHSADMEQQHLFFVCFWPSLSFYFSLVSLSLLRKASGFSAAEYSIMFLAGCCWLCLYAVWCWAKSRFSVCFISYEFNFSFVRRRFCYFFLKCIAWFFKAQIILHENKLKFFLFCRSTLLSLQTFEKLSKNRLFQSLRLWCTTPSYPY